MLTQEDLRRLHLASVSPEPEARERVLRELGRPGRDEIVAAGLAGLDSHDRNARVLMLRVLAHESGSRASRGILRGLRDSQRRVREVAIKSCAGFLGFPEIVSRLKEIVEDEAEKRKLRAGALFFLSGGGPVRGRELPGVAIEALGSLARLPDVRQRILFNLLRVGFTDDVRSMLQEFVDSGTREEAVMATRGLSGFQIMNLGEIQDSDERRKFAQTAELAQGRVWFWVRRLGDSGPRPGSESLTR